MKRLALLVSASLVSTAAWAIPIANPGNGHYYDVIPAPGITWQDARAAALSQSFLGLQGHLATITSADEHGYVNLAIQQNGGGEMWAGGYQNPENETNPQAGWTWVNGEGTFPGFDSISPYAKWNGGEPNDYWGTGSEQFLGLNVGPGFNDEWYLPNITGYVIEYDPNTINDVPEAGMTASLLAGALALLGSVSRRIGK